MKVVSLYASNFSKEGWEYIEILRFGIEVEVELILNRHEEAS
jgi:hypothetical protein